MKKNYLLFLLLILVVNFCNAQNGGYALKFNGVDGKVSATLNTGNTNSTTTFECWISQVTAQAGTQFFADLHSISGINRRRIMPFLNNGAIGIYCAPNTDDDNNAITQNSGVTVLPGKWYHIAVTINGSTLKMYINGKLYVNTNLTDVYSLTGTEILTLGADYWGNTFANIRIDEARVWSTERTEAQIKANMFKELVGNEAGLLAYYKMSNGSGTTLTHDQTLGIYDGTLSGGVTWKASGAFAGSRNALDFDGADDYVDCGNGASLKRNGMSAVSVEAWVKPTGGVWAAVASKFVHTAAAEGYSLEIFSDNKVALLMGNNWSDWNACSSSIPVTPGAWNHIAATYDGATMRVYVNGVLAGSTSFANGITDSGTDFLIGCRSGTTFFPGQIDEVRVWNTARTETELRENMMHTLVGNEAGLSAYYRLDNIDGVNIYDLSANANNGTLTNMDANTDWVTSEAFNTWIGGESNLWGSADNWSAGSVPGVNENIGIYGWAIGSQPILSGNPTFRNILFSSTSSSTIGSNFTCNGNLMIDKNTDLNGNTITLGTTANLVENPGYLYGSSGVITTTRPLNNINSLNVAGLGAKITTVSNLGNTTISRGHTQQTGNGNNSILRYYDISPTNNSSLNVFLEFNYLDGELNAIAENNLRLFKSIDGGTTWTGGTGTVNAASNTVTLAGITSLSRWTLGDITHSLIINPPNSPVAIAASLVTTTSFSANWNASATATKYYLDVATDAGFTHLVAGYNNLDVNNVTTYSVSGLSEGVTYYYRVRAMNAGGTSANSNTITAITIPTAPIAASATNITTTTFSANWSAFAGAAGYYLDVAIDPGFTSFFTGYNNKDVSNVLTFSVIGLNPGTTYFYRVRSYNGGGSSSNSNSISVITIPDAPVATAATDVTLTGFTANWNASPGGIVKVSPPKNEDFSKTNVIPFGYFLDVATDIGFTNFLAGYNNKNVGNVTSETITGLNSGTYYYRVRVRNGSGTSESSNIIGVSLLVVPVVGIPPELNFGDVTFASEAQIKTFKLSNSGNAVLRVDNFTLENTAGVFEVLTPSPVVLEPNTQYDVRVKMNPVKEGDQNFKLHLINNSTAQDAVIQLKANIKLSSGAETLEPHENNFGTTTKDSNTVITTFVVFNSSNQPGQITGLSIIGDTASFSVFFNNIPLTFPITLNPGDRYEIQVRFLPQSVGAKFASLKVVMSDGNSLYARLYGVAQGSPEILLSKNELNFGELTSGSVKTDSIIIKNSGTLNLTINSKIITGIDRNSFILTGSNEMITLKAGESQIVKIMALGVLPVGNRSADLHIGSNDPLNSGVTVKLSSLIKTGLISALNLIEMDTTDIDLCRDTIIVLKNTGNLPVVIDNLTFDGAYSEDFTIAGSALPINLQPDEEANITIRFSPKDIGLRYARLVIHSTDPATPLTYIVFKGNGIKIIKFFAIKGKVLFNGKALSGVKMALSGDASSNQTTDEDGSYSYTFGRLKNYIITPSLAGFTFNPASRSYSNVLSDDENFFEAINEAPYAVILLTPENNKNVNLIYPTVPLVFKWKKSEDPEGLPIKYELNIKGGSLNKIYSDLTDTVFTADIMKELVLNTSYNWFVISTDGINNSKSETSVFRTSNSTTEIEKISNTPVSYELSQNYPNPFNPETIIKYSIPENAFVTIKVYNTVGKEIALLVNNFQPAGIYQVSWRPNNEPSGVYYYKITAGNFKFVRKMVYVR